MNRYANAWNVFQRQSLPGRHGAGLGGYGLGDSGLGATGGSPGRGWSRFVAPPAHPVWTHRRRVTAHLPSRPPATQTDFGDETTGTEQAERSGSASNDNDRTRLEAILFLAKSPLSLRKLASMAELEDATRARTLVGELNQLYDAQGRGIRVESIAGGYRLMTRAVVAPWLSRLGFLPPAVRLSWPMMETLAVVAYRQDVTRADMEAVRGVACGEILRQLMQIDLVRISGRSEDLGRPYLYGTTKRFLKLCGLPSIKALPPIDWHTVEDDLSGVEKSEPDRDPSVAASPEQDDAASSAGIHPDHPDHPVPDSPPSGSPVPKESDVSIVATETLATAPSASPLIVPSVVQTGRLDEDQSTQLPAGQDPQGVIEDEEDDLYEKGLDNDDDDEIDEDWDDELDEDDDELDDDEEGIEDEDDDDWEEVDDDDADEDWEEDEDDDWEEEDDDAADDDEDWDD